MERSKRELEERKKKREELIAQQEAERLLKLGGIANINVKQKNDIEDVDK